MGHDRHISIQDLSSAGSIADHAAASPSFAARAKSATAAFVKTGQGMADAFVVPAESWINPKEHQRKNAPPKIEKTSSKLYTEEFSGVAGSGSSGVYPPPKKTKLANVAESLRTSDALHSVVSGDGSSSIVS
jgi:hypothetical protein